MNVLISVIVPVYKVEQYLQKCVDSILNQTYKNLEIILVDDGSPDTCPQMCDAFAKKDQRIKVIHTTNGGVSRARNMALDIATGDYIGFVDSDDWIEPQMYEILYQSILDTNAQIAIISCMKDRDASDSGAPSSDCLYDISKVEVTEPQEALKRMCLGTKYEGHMWVKLINRDLFEATRFPETITICEDMLVSTQLFTRSKKIAYYPYWGYHYLQREDSALHQLAKESDWSVLDACTQMCDIVGKDYPELTPYFDFLFMQQALILAMRLNHAGALNRSSLNAVRKRIKTHISPEADGLLSKGSRIRIRALYFGRIPFTLCNYLLRCTRKYR